MTKPKLLIIDDERALQEVLTYNFEKEGFEVSVASDGENGLHYVRSLHPDIVILDLMLPGIDGREVCRQIRRDPQLLPTRILMLTVRSEEIDEVEGFEAGVDDYLTKPFKVHPLINRIKALLSRNPNGSRIAE